MNQVYSLALITHLIGLTLMAGVTSVSAITTRQFWNQYSIDKQKALAIHTTMSVAMRLFGIGILLLIVSGITMMAYMHTVYGEQTWFRIKFGLVLLIIVNGIALGIRQNKKLTTLLVNEPSGKNRDAAVLRIRRNTRLYYITQLTLFIMVIILSVFKFD